MFDLTNLIVLPCSAIVVANATTSCKSKSNNDRISISIDHEIYPYYLLNSDTVTYKCSATFVSGKQKDVDWILKDLSTQKSKGQILLDSNGNLTINPNRVGDFKFNIIAYDATNRDNCASIEINTVIGEVSTSPIKGWTNRIPINSKKNIFSRRISFSCSNSSDWITRRSLKFI